MNIDPVVIPYPVLGPPPANLQIREATRQNTLVLNDGDHFRINSPGTHGGPDVWTWHITNFGPGVLWARWDGLGYADVNDPNSIMLVAGYGFQDISAPTLTFACQGGTTISFTATNIES